MAVSIRNLPCTATAATCPAAATPTPNRCVCGCPMGVGAVAAVRGTAGGPAAPLAAARAITVHATRLWGNAAAAADHGVLPAASVCSMLLHHIRRARAADFSVGAARTSHLPPQPHPTPTKHPNTQHHLYTRPPAPPPCVQRPASQSSSPAVAQSTRSQQVACGTPDHTAVRGVARVCY